LVWVSLKESCLEPPSPPKGQLRSLLWRERPGSVTDCAGSSGMGKTSRNRQIACRTTIDLSLLWKLTLCAFLFRQMDPRFVLRWYYRYFLCVHGVGFLMMLSRDRVSMQVKANRPSHSSIKTAAPGSCSRDLLVLEYSEPSRRLCLYRGTIRKLGKPHRLLQCYYLELRTPFLMTI
jgi:hypothetical protein